MLSGSKAIDRSLFPSLSSAGAALVMQVAKKCHSYPENSRFHPLFTACCRKNRSWILASCWNESFLNPVVGVLHDTIEGCLRRTQLRIPAMLFTLIICGSSFTCTCLSIWFFQGSLTAWRDGLLFKKKKGVK